MVGSCSCCRAHAGGFPGYAGDKDKKDDGKGTAIGKEPKVIDGELRGHGPDRQDDQ